MADSLFPELDGQRAPDPTEGLGRDARKTLRDYELVAQGINPGTRLTLHVTAAKERTGPGGRCRDCSHLYRTVVAVVARRQDATLREASSHTTKTPKPRVPQACSNTGHHNSTHHADNSSNHPVMSPSTSPPQLPAPTGPRESPGRCASAPAA